jgi:hypothetical protein
MVGALLFLHHHSGVEYQDVNLYQHWAHVLIDGHRLPAAPTWQYPPGAAAVLVLPALLPFGYKPSFVVFALVCDAAVAVILARAGRRPGHHTTGLWLWLLLVPMLGDLTLLRFDVVVALVAVVALLASSPRGLGIASGIGALVKLWPAFLLIAPAETRERSRACTWAIVTMTVLTGALWLAFGDPLSFLRHQWRRGLQEEAVATSPWRIRQVLTGIAPLHRFNEGSINLIGPDAERIAHLLFPALVVAMVAFGALSVIRARSLATNPSLGDPSVGCALAFTAVSAFLVLSPVLSPQYLIWLIAVAAVVATRPGSDLLRTPLLLTAVAVALTQPILPVWRLVETPIGASILLARNTVLLAAAVTAAYATARAIVGEHARPREPSTSYTVTVDGAGSL